MKIDTAAVQLAAAAEIEDARDKFGALSEAIDTYMTGLKLTAPEGVKRRVLPDGPEAVAAGVGHHRQPVLRQEHVHLRQLPVNIPFTRHTLANGLDVLLHEDHACPIVAVNLWYHVGSKNEQPGRTGFAHLFEHLMFEGSRAPRPRLLPAAAGRRRVAERLDQRRSHQLLGGGADQRARARAVDGIGSHGLPAAGADRGQVHQPARRRAERAPPELREPSLRPGADGDARGAVSAAIIPYHWPTIGEIADLQAAQARRRARVLPPLLPSGQRVARARRRHRPRAGARAGRALLRRDRAGRARSIRSTSTASLAGDVRLLLEDRVELPRLYLAWLSPAMFADGDADLDLADRPAGQRQDVAPLSRGWCSTSGIATDVSASQNSREMAASSRSPRPRRPATRSPSSSAAILEEIARLAADGPTDEEIERGRVQAEAQFIFRLQTVGGFGGKSDQLNAYNVFLGDPAYFDRRPGSATRSCTRRRCRRRSRATSTRPAASRSASCRTAAPTLALAGFDAGGRVVTSTARRGRSLAAAGAGPDAAVSVSRDREVDAAQRPARLDRAPHAGAAGRVHAADPPRRRRPIRPARTGSPPITADMLDEGSGDRSAIEIHEALARIGAQLDTDIGSDATRRSASPCSAASPTAALDAARRHASSRPALREARLRSRPPAAAASADAAARHARARSPIARSCSCSTARIPTATRRSAAKRRSRR